MSLSWAQLGQAMRCDSDSQTLDAIHFHHMRLDGLAKLRARDVVSGARVIDPIWPARAHSDCDRPWRSTANHVPRVGDRLTPSIGKDCRQRSRDARHLLKRKLAESILNGPACARA